MFTTFMPKPAAVGEFLLIHSLISCSYNTVVGVVGNILVVDVLSAVIRVPR